MLNQSFNYDNIRDIYENERRKGFDLDRKFFKDIYEINKKLKTLRMEKSDSPEKSKQYQDMLDMREQLVQKEILYLCSDDNISNYKIEITASKCPKGKNVYMLRNDDVISYFYMKLIQNNIRKCYKVVQSDRFKISKQLQIILNDKVPKSILRIDIKNFYENIPHFRIMNFINSNPILSASTRNMICTVLSRYSKYSLTKIGIPRGLGISSYLAELYMRNFDSTMRNKEKVIFYARYVDDIVIVFSGELDEKPIIKDIKFLLGSLGLEMHDSGNKFFFATHSEYGKRFNYLGYEYKLVNSGVLIDISTDRVKKIKKKLELSIIEYNKKRRKFLTIRNKKLKTRLDINHENLLIKRIKFLTSNAKLHNSKQRTAVGIFYSNRLITTSNGLNECDLFLSNMLRKMSNRVIRKVKGYTFVSGFQARRFVKFTTQEFDEITKVWKYVS